MNLNPVTFETSRDAYGWCIENNVISKSVAEALKVMSEGVPLNQTLAYQAVVRTTGNMGLESRSVGRRFSVLRRMGLIREVGKSPCPVTGRPTLFFEATNTRPTCTEAEAIKSANKRELPAEVVAELKLLREDNAKLRELLNMRSQAHQEREERIRRAPVQIQTDFFASAQ
jgi:hypothetical protein